MSKNRFSRTFGRIAGALQGQSRQKIETEYLNGSVSIYDLERRMQEIERGKFRDF